MDNLNDWELETIIRYIPFSIRQEWNMTRNVMLAALKPYLKDKNITAENLVPLVGDDDYGETEHNIEISNAEIEKLTKQAEILSQIIARDEGEQTFDIKNIKEKKCQID